MNLEKEFRETNSKIKAVGNEFLLLRSDIDKIGQKITTLENNVNTMMKNQEKFNDMITKVILKEFK